jgi:hypothetical protein
MGVQPRVDYERIFGMGNAVLPKLRKLIGGDALSWNDRELRNILDMAVDKQIRAGNVEEWWEDDWAYGISQNRVVRVDEMLPAGYNYNIPPLYAIIREGVQGDIDIIIAIVDQDDYDKSIIDQRWTEKKPEKSKYRHPGEPEETDAQEETEEPHVPSEKQPPSGTATAVEDQVVLIVSTTHHHDGEKTTTIECPESMLQGKVFALIAQGVLPQYIKIWRHCSTVELNISLKPHHPSQG